MVFFFSKDLKTDLALSLTLLLHVLKSAAAEKAVIWDLIILIVLNVALLIRNLFFIAGYKPFTLPERPEPHVHRFRTSG